MVNDLCVTLFIRRTACKPSWRTCTIVAMDVLTGVLASKRIGEDPIDSPPELLQVGVPGLRRTARRTRESASASGWESSLSKDAEKHHGVAVSEGLRLSAGSRSLEYCG
jgi:hypothetical protein